MFGHLKAKDFVNLMEGIELPAKHRSHLEACTQCQAAWKSVQSIHAELGSLDAGIPEPDWTQFRSSVRDRLLSRSIQRESAVRRWTGWAVRPAMAWALSLLLVVGLTTVVVLWDVSKVLWDVSKTPAPSNSVGAPAPEPLAETIEAGPERGLFDDLVQLGEDQQEQLQQILASSQDSRYR
jgi:hypothetical protein